MTNPCMTRWSRFIAVCWLLFGLHLAGPARAAEALPAGVTRQATVEGITEYRLPNGLKVLLFPDASRPTVTVNVTYLVGSRHENYGETGMAHLLEHLMFKGAASHPFIAGELDRRGMDYNGTTSNDRTNYYESFTAGDDNLRWVLGMEADRMTGAKIAREDLASEMTVVRNEYEMGENSPFEVLSKRLQSVAYDWHSNSRATIGNRSDIENVGIANLRAFYTTYYQPDNAVLLVAGRFDAAKALDWIAQDFGRIARPARTLPPSWTVEPVQDGERSVTVRRRGDVQIVALAYKIPGALHADADALTYMADILGDTPNGRLHKQLVETGMAAEIFSYVELGLAPGMQVLGAVIGRDEPVEPVRDALIAAAESFYRQPPTADEMARAARNAANTFDSMLTDPQRVALALSEAIALGDWRLLFYGRDRYAQVQAGQVAQAARRYIVRDNRIAGLFLPEDKPMRAEIPPAPSAQVALRDYTGRPDGEAGEAFDPAQDNIDRRTRLLRAGGLKLALLPKRTRGESVAVAINLRWGDEHTLFGKSVIPSMTSAMLLRGTTRYTRQQLSDAFDRLQFSGSVNSFETTREHLAEALRLAIHVMREPSFPQAEFDQLKNAMLTGLEAKRSDPQAIATRELARRFNQYPKGDVRAHMSLDEQIAAIKAATLDDVKAFYRDFHGASHGEVAIVGDFDADEAARVIEQDLAGWPSRAPFEPIRKRNIDAPPLHLGIDTPDRENGFYVARLNLDLGTADPDYPALVLANYIFGDSGLKSRLLERIRGRDGLSYGGGSNLSVSEIDRAASFVVAAIAAPQNLGRVERAVTEEIDRAARDGFTDDEVATAKSSILQQRAQSRADDASLADGWVRYLFMDRTFAYSREFEQRLMQVTPAQVTAAFRRLIDPRRLAVVMAGDAGKSAYLAEVSARPRNGAGAETAGSTAAMLAPVVGAGAARAAPVAGGTLAPAQ
jgi:zinc protease